MRSARRTPTRAAGAPAGRAPAGLVALVAAAALLVGAGCGGGRQDRAGQGSPEEPQDSLAALAAEVEERFRSAIEDESGMGTAQEAARDAAQDLVLAVLEGERPPGGWRPEVLEAALLERRLTAQAREVTRGSTPWLVLVGDPLRPEVPVLALLTYPDAGSAARMEIEPFRHPFQMAAWPDTAGPLLLVAGTQRSPAGPQPTAWLFRLPESPPAPGGPALFLAAAGKWELAASGQARVAFQRADPDSAPRLVVTNSALPNPLFDECPSCPHLEADIEYAFVDSTLTVVERQVRRTPYAAFVGLVEGLVVRDPRVVGYAANRRVLEQALALGLDRLPVAGRWRIAPGVSAKSLDQIYLRGREGAVRVLFAPGDTGFVVTSLSPTTFKLD